MEGVVCDRALFGGRPGQRVPLSGQVGLLQEVCAREILEESLPREWSVAERYTRRGWSLPKVLLEEDSDEYELEATGLDPSKEVVRVRVERGFRSELGFFQERVFGELFRNGFWGWLVKVLSSRCDVGWTFALPDLCRDWVRSFGRASARSPWRLEVSWSCDRKA